MKVNCAMIEGIETSVSGQFMGYRRGSIVIKHSKRYTSLLMVLNIMAVDPKVVLKYLD